MVNNNILKFLFVLFLSGSIMAQSSGREYRRSAILNGNNVKTVFGNWGVIGQPATGGPRGAWIYETNGYIGDVSPMVGAEVVPQNQPDSTFFWVIDCPVGRPAASRDQSEDGTRQAFEPVSGYFNEMVSSPAISSKKETWPAEWPDIKDPNDPRYDPEGWGGSWNGFFGRDIFNADLETYYVMNDQNDNEYSIASENTEQYVFLPDSTNPGRYGLGLEVRVRGLQWQQILAQDNIFWLYNIRNNGTYTYPRTVYGMLVGTYVGCTGNADHQEYDDDYSFFDVGEDLTYTGDFPNNNSRNPFWVGRVGLVGYAFLESPGNPFDGIDNDNDADSLSSAAPFFTELDFPAPQTPVTFTTAANPGPFRRNSFVTIEKIETVNPFGQPFVEYVRTLHPITQDTTVAVSLGETFLVIVGDTVNIEGNTIDGGNEVNPNAYDGIDNDLDGLIDENYFLHYRQRRTASTGQILFDILNPIRHVDYFTGMGSQDNMVDERREDGIDNDGDWSRNPVTGEYVYDDEGILIDDVGMDGKPGTGDAGEGDGAPTPGEPNFDALDKSESDQIGLTSFQYFAPAGDIELASDSSMTERFRPGFFEVPNTIVNGEPIAGEDGDFLYGTGYFPLTPGQIERLSLALIYGYTRDELVKKLQTVRDIYNADYRFPIAPEKPTLTAVPGDNQVMLYWDRVSEHSYDPVLREFDFEGYKIYRSTDPGFNDVRVVTNSSGQLVGYEPLVQYDLVNDINEYFYAPYDLYQILQGWAFYLGDDTGLQHSYVDNNVKNGQTYYYALVAYDRGDELAGIIPTENTKQISLLNNGMVELDINTVVVMPTKSKAGYVAPKDTASLDHSFGDGAGNVSYKILDPTALTGHDYEVFFWDTSNDGEDNDGDWVIANDVGADGIANTGDEGEGDGEPTPGEPNFDFRDPQELKAITTQYGVKDLSEFNEEFTPRDTLFVQLLRSNLDAGSVLVRDGFGNEVDADSYILDWERGRIRASVAGSLANQVHLISYYYHPIYKSEYIQGNPNIDPITDTEIFDGVTLNFENIWQSRQDIENSGWSLDTIRFKYSLVSTTLVIGPYRIIPVLTPFNYEIRYSSEVVDTTSGIIVGIPSLAPAPRKFEIINTTGNYTIEYLHIDRNNNQYLDENEDLIFVEKDPDGEFTIFAWYLKLGLNAGEPDYNFVGGEVLTLKVEFPLNKLDKFRLHTEMPRIDNELAKDQLRDVLVYPNPYIVAHEFEPKLPPGVTSGRGERRIYFSRLPDKAKIHIFTARGEHVTTLEEHNAIFNGTLIWDLKTKENLDIAYGVYFYVIDSPVGKKRGKLAVIK